MPTQIGRTASPPESFRITMGMFVTGSIIKPRIFISTSIPDPLLGSDYHFPNQAIGKTCGDANVGIAAHRRLERRRHHKIQRLVLGGATHPLIAGCISSLNHYFSYLAHMSHV